MTGQGPLAGLRVVDLTADLGRFASKLLAEYGAEVCRPVALGTRGRPIEGKAGELGGVLDWWFDGAKHPIALDLDRDEGVGSYRELTASADLVIEAMPVGYLAERGVDHTDLVAGNPRLTQVSITPFGRTGPRAHWHGSDLVAGALSGVLSITGTPDEPLNSWGWQNYNFAGFAGALSGLAGVRSARRSGRGQLVDLSVHEVVTGSIENLFMQFFYDDLLPIPKLAARQGSLHWLGAYEVVPARAGNIMVTPTPQAEQLVEWMVASGIERAERFVGMPVEELLVNISDLMAAMHEFAATADAGELWQEAQKRHIAFGEVQRVSQVAANPQFAHREFFTDITVGLDGVSDDAAAESGVRGPWRLVRFSDTPITTPTVDPKPADPGVVAERWRQLGVQPQSDAEPAQPSDKPLDGLVVLDLSWVLAGPFSTRLLGDLGADVIKLQTEERATLVNRPDFPYYPVWNRSKRSVTIDLKHPDAVDVVRRLVEQADVLVENYSAGVLERLGLGWDTVREWNERLVYISMSGCGHDGPWSEVISYAPTIHALCGLTHLTNPPGRGDVGCGFSLNDHAAGFAAAYSVLAALEARERTGRGQYIDMAQLEVGGYLVGPALVDYWANGVDSEPAGNHDGLAESCPSSVVVCRDGRHLAVSAVDDQMWSRLAPVLGLDGPALASCKARLAAVTTIETALGRWGEQRDADTAMDELQAIGVAAGVVQDAGDIFDRDPQHAARGFWLTADLGEYGERPHDRFPALWSTSELAPYRKPPAYLGEANFDVLVELAGLDPETIAEGIASGLFT